MFDIVIMGDKSAMRDKDNAHVPYKKILCIIPARSGSKGLPHKNIKRFRNKPLMAWSIGQAKVSRFASQMRVIVSTDSNSYAQVARHYGAETPFLRPAEISGDLSTDYEFLSHAVNWLRDNENYTPDIILQLRPTSPLRKVEDIDKCLETFIQNMDEYDSLRSVIPIDKSPYKMYRVENNQTLLQPLFNEVEGITEPYNQCRQVLPQCYLHNGYIDILKPCLLEEGIISGDRIYPFVMSPEDNVDIDHAKDMLVAASSTKNV